MKKVFFNLKEFFSSSAFKLYSFLFTGIVYCSSFFILCIVLALTAKHFNFSPEIGGIVSISPFLVFAILARFSKKGNGLSESLLKTITTIVSVFVVLYFLNYYLKLLAVPNDVLAGPLAETEKFLNEFFIVNIFFFLLLMVYVFVLIYVFIFILFIAHKFSKFLRNALIFLFIVAAFLPFALYKSKLDLLFEFLIAHTGFILGFSLFSLHLGYLVQNIRNRIVVK